MIFQSTTTATTTSSGKATQAVVIMKACVRVGQGLWRMTTSIMMLPNEQTHGVTMSMTGNRTAEGGVEPTLWEKTIRTATHRSPAGLRRRSRNSHQSQWRGRIKRLHCSRSMRINLVTCPSRKGKSLRSPKERRTHRTGGRERLETGRESFRGM